MDSYLGFSDQAADLDGRGWRRGNRERGGACKSRGRGSDGRGDDDAGQRGGARLAARLPVDDADLVDGRGRGQRGRQLGGQHDGPLEQLGGRHHWRGRGRGDGDVGGRGQPRPDLLTTNNQSGNGRVEIRHGWVTTRRSSG